MNLSIDTCNNNCKALPKPFFTAENELAMLHSEPDDLVNLNLESQSYQ